MACSFWRASYRADIGRAQTYRRLAQQFRGDMRETYVTLARLCHDRARASLALPADYRGGLVSGYELPDGTHARQETPGARYVHHYQINHEDGSYSIGIAA